MSNKFYLFIASLFIIGCSSDEVDTFGGISGTVADEITREPLAGVKVALTPTGSSQVTGTDGNFLFDNLDPQEYTLTFTKDDYVSQSQKVSVKAGLASSVQVSMEPIVPVLKATPTKLDFGQETTTLALDITNSGKGTLQWSINEEIAWLSCSPSRGTTNKESSSVVVTISRAELERGNYNGTLVISSNGGSQEIPVSMSVESVNLDVTPAEADFGTLTSSMQLTLKNTGSGTLKYTVESSNEWLVLSKTSGSVTETDYIEAIVSRAGLSAGKYNATITFSVNGGNVVVPVKMEVAVNEKPTVTAENATDITYNSAILHGTMVSVGSAKVTKYGFCWSEQPTPTIENAHSNLGDCSAPMAFESVANDLQSDTKYYFRAYAENSVGIVYSEKELSFTVAGLPTLPSVMSGSVSEVTSTTVKAKGNITSLGNVSKVTAYGHVWSKTAQPTLQTGKYTNLGEATESISFTSEITELDAHTTYYIRAYATNEKGTAYGDDITFNTLNTDVVLSTSDVTDIIHNEATCGGTITDDGGHTITERGVCWNTKSVPTIDNSHVSATNTTSVSAFASRKIAESRTEYVTRADDSFSCRITGLTKETPYYVRAYVKTSDGTVFYGDEKQFTTTKEVSLPTLADMTVSNVQTTSATVVSKVESDGNSTITECGFCYSKSAAPNIETGTKIACDPASAELGKNITGLEEGTTYHIRAYAKNAMGTAYSKEAEFTTLAVTAPQLSEVTVENVGRTTAYASATITETGNASITECGFCWATNPYPTVYDNKVTCEVGDTFTAKLQDLPLLTTVYVRAYAINSKGTGYSSDTSFTTTDTDIDIWDGVSVATKFGGGIGTESDPIIINSADQLAFLAKNVNNGTTYVGVHFQLAVNLGLGNHDWTVIGNSTHPFNGIFNGNGYMVTGLYINSYANEQGLFGCVNGTIYNLTVEGNINARDYVGGICARLISNGKLQQCTNKVNISGNNYTGGICGYNTSGIIYNNVNYGTITGNGYTGGVLGFWKESSQENTSYIIRNCANYGNISSADAAGGIIGRLEVTSQGGTTSKYDMYRRVYCKIYNCANYARVEGQYAGGICGYAKTIGSFTNRTYGKETYLGIADVTNCINNATIISTNNAGAIYGYAECAKYSTSFYGGEILINSSYWLNDIANQIGLESAYGNTNYQCTQTSTGWYSHNGSSCMLNNNGYDIVSLLNQWVFTTSNVSYKHWTYETIDDFACPVLED